jgi:hypothetical protein
MAVILRESGGVSSNAEAGIADDIKRSRGLVPEQSGSSG